MGFGMGEKNPEAQSAQCSKALLLVDEFFIREYF
jgi:hypothetical protein